MSPAADVDLGTGPAAGPGDPPPFMGVDYETEILLCRADPAYFTDTYATIDDAQNNAGELKGVTRFRLWPDQVAVMWDIRDNKLVIILKARQLGISWLVMAYVLWKALFYPGQNILLVSKGIMESQELLRRVKVLYERLPADLKLYLPTTNPRVDNTRGWALSNGSLVRSMASNANTGISFTASLVVMDEAAHQRSPGELYSNIKPTIDDGGPDAQLVILSTANGLGGFFYSLWTKTVEGLSGFKSIFLPWWSRPTRDAAWYNRMVREANDPEKIPQNYPANPIEAFLASGRHRFHPSWIGYQVPNVCEPLPPEAWPESLSHRTGWDGCSLTTPDPRFQYDLPTLLDLHRTGGLMVYSAPVPGRKYVIGADVAEGLENGDYDSAVVIDAQTWEEVASLHGHWEPDLWGDYLMVLSEPYRATVVVERNSHGHATIGRMRRKFFPRIAAGADRHLGWHSNPRTKPEGIDLLAEALRKQLIKVRTPATLTEFQMYARLRAGALGAINGHHDDRVIAWYCALSWIRYKGSTTTTMVPAAVGDPIRTVRALRA